MSTTCETTNCGKEAKLRCPTCVKHQIAGSYFCSQECFKGFWKEHKVIHQLKNLKASDGDNVSSAAQALWPGYKFSGELRPYKKSAKRMVPSEIQRPDYAGDVNGTPHSEREVRGANIIKILDDEEIEAMRVACRLAREVLDEGVKAIDIGVTTDEIDRVVHEASVDRECYPSPLNYYKFPKSCCTSVNEVICHGIPDFRPLTDGDILNIDVTVYHRGFHGDLNETMFVGNVDDTSRMLVKTTHECLSKAIEAVRPGFKYRDIGDIIQKHAQTQNLSVVRTYCGHGIHRYFHCSPNVPHYARNKAVGVMKAGHCFTIEPMINMGTWRDDRWPDDWTAVTQDGKRSAQFEETLLVTDNGCEVLTARRSPFRQPYFLDCECR